MATSEFVEAVMKDWNMAEQSSRIQSCLRKVLAELSDGACRRLRDDKLEVKILPTADYGVWAYFPIHRRRWITRELYPKETTRVLLVLGTSHFEEESLEVLEDWLRDHLGHSLLYLREPKAKNVCSVAQEEWEKSCQG
jgi:hypothetical protein